MSSDNRIFNVRFENIAEVYCHCIDCSQRVVLHGIPKIPGSHSLFATAACGCGVVLCEMPGSILKRNNRVSILRDDLQIVSVDQVDTWLQEFENHAQALVIAVNILREVTK